MKINVNLARFGYCTASVDLDGTNDLDNSVSHDATEPLTAIAHAVLHHLMATGQLTLVVNDIEIKPHEDDEIAFDVFFNSDLDDYLK